MIKRLIVLTLILSACLPLLANGTGEKSATADKIVLTLYCAFPPGARQVMSSLADHSVVKELERMTGYELEFMHPPEGDDGTFFNTTIASGEYPDLISHDFNRYPGGPEGAMADGVLVNMNSLIAEHAPNWNKRITDAGEVIRKKTISDNGTIIRFGTIFQCEILEGKVHRGLFMRKDILDTLGLQTPRTTDEFKDALRAIKNLGSFVTPLALSKASDNTSWGGGTAGINTIASAFGVTHRGYFLKNGQVAFAPVQPEYKDYLTFLFSLYDEGLLYADFPNLVRSDTVKMLSGNQTASAALGNWETRQVLQLGQSDNPGFDLAPVPVLKQNANDPKSHLTGVQESVNQRTWFLTTTCKHPIEAIKLIDMFHDEEVNRMFAWGLQEVDGNTLWVEKDGKRTFTDFMQKNPQMDYPTARDRYTLNPFQTRWDQEMEIQQYNHPKNGEAWDIWSASADNANLLPGSMTLTIEESREHASIMTSVETYTDEMFYKYVTGLESLDTFDKYLAEIRSMDIDVAVALQQAAYSRYLKR